MQHISLMRIMGGSQEEVAKHNYVTYFRVIITCFYALLYSGNNFDQIIKIRNVHYENGLKIFYLKKKQKTYIDGCVRNKRCFMLLLFITIHDYKINIYSTNICIFFII